MLKKMYKIIFAPPFDGFGIITINVSLMWIISYFAIKLDPLVTFYIGMMTYPIIVYVRKKLEKI